MKLSHQKGHAQLLLILLILIVVIGGIYFYQNTKGKTLPQNPIVTVPKKAEAQEYLNKDLGYTFKYSDNLTVREDSEEEFNKRGNGDFRKNFKGYVGYEPGKVLGAVVLLDKSNAFDNSPFTVWVFNNDDNLLVEQWFQNYWYYPFLWGVFDYTSKAHIALDKEATISGQTAKYKVVSYQPGSPKFIYVSNDKKIYLFKIISGSDNIGDQILSTFKFLK